jgi:hypothetical protein
MAKLTWLGEDDLHGGAPGPSFTTAFGGTKFEKGKPVEVRSYGFVRKALGNQFFEVSDPDDVDDAPEMTTEETAEGIMVKRKPGRPRKVEAEKAETRETVPADHYSDDEIDALNVSELRELADQRGIDHAGMNKTELREALK